MHLVYSLEESPNLDLPSIFLAGPTPRQYSGVRSWRPRAVKILEQLGFEGIVYIPENRNIRSKINHKLQPKWEHEMLYKSSCVLFWVPRDLKKLPGLTTNVEYGLFATSGKAVLGAPKRAQKMSYFRFMAEEFSIPQHSNLKDTIMNAVRVAEKSKHKKNNVEYLYCPFCASKLGVIIEEHKKRKYCNNCKWIYYPKPDIAVAGVTIRTSEDGKTYVLMVKRNRAPFAETWMFPAGFLEAGERPDETLIREFNEETGLSITKYSLIGILKAENDPRNPNHLVIFYLAETEGIIVNNDSDENSSIAWQSLDDDIEIGFTHHKRVFEVLKQMTEEQKGGTE